MLIKATLFFMHRPDSKKKGKCKMKKSTKWFSLSRRSQRNRNRGNRLRAFQAATATRTQKQRLKQNNQMTHQAKNNEGRKQRFCIGEQIF